MQPQTLSDQTFMGGTARSKPQTGNSNPQPVIAVVDDDPCILRALDRLIRSHGWLARVFSSTTEFVASASVTPPDCLILDVQMPRMSGLEVHQRLLEQGCKFPVIFMTAHEDPNAEAEAGRSGAAGFFYKPFRNEVLWAAVLKALAARRTT